jgi:purine-binding chemotaxis protein CheW
MMVAQVPALVFTLGPQEYAILIEDVTEVAAMVEMHTVPGSRPEILGVINRHGSVLWMIDLRLVFNQPRKPIDISTLFIVAQRGDTQVGLVVDEVQQVEYLDLTLLQSAPTSSETIMGILTQGERLIQLISLSPLLIQYAPVSTSG